MKKYKIDNYIVKANSIYDAVSIVRQIKDAYNNGIILEKHETYKGPNGQFTVVKVRRDNGRIQYVVTSDKWDIDAGDKMPSGTIENDLASAIKTAKEYANARRRNSDATPMKGAAKDSVTVREVIESLVTEETSAIASYNVALETLRDHIPAEAYEAIKAIRDDEQRHVENLYAVLNGNVTPKNLEDSVKDDTVMFPGSKLYKVAIKYGFLDNEKLAKKIAADPEWQAIINKYRDPLYSAPSSIDRIVKKYMK